jgi:hypothetical protein
MSPPLLSILLTIFIAALFTPGCVPSGTTASKQLVRSDAARTYQPVNFSKWASGLYPDEFFGKHVIVEGYYNPNPFPGIAISNTISFSISEKSTQQIQSEAMAGARSGRYIGPSDIHVVAAVAPISMRDTFYELEPGAHIRVYGHVTNPYSRSVFHGRVVTSSLQVQTERIEVL